MWQLICAAVLASAWVTGVPTVSSADQAGLTAEADVGLVISVEAYTAGLPAKHARADALRFDRLLRETVGVPADRVVHLSAEHVTASGLKAAVARVRTLVARRPGGRLWVHVGGHGMMLEEAAGHVAAHLILAEARPEPDGRPSLTVNLDALLDQLDALPFREGVAVMEVCRVGPRLSWRPSSGRWPAPRARARVHVWWGSQPGQMAADSDAFGGGVLTHFAQPILSRQAAKGRFVANEARQRLREAIRGHFGLNAFRAPPPTQLVPASGL